METTGDGDTTQGRCRRRAALTGFAVAAIVAMSLAASGDRVSSPQRAEPVDRHERPQALAGAAAGSRPAGRLPSPWRGRSPGADSAARRSTAAPPAIARGKGRARRIVVIFRRGSTRAARAAALRAAGVHAVKWLPSTGAAIVEPARGASPAARARALARSPAVAVAETARKRSFEYLPNDPLFPRQWGLRNTGQVFLDDEPAGTPDADIDADEAWDIAPLRAAPIAVIDTGVAYNHPDLAGKVWVNSREAAGTPGVDDDGNGYVDDVRGWDFLANDARPEDSDGHGTHVAGVAAAATNDGAGVAGVAPTAPIVALRAGSFASGVDSGTVVEAIEYAARAGARVVNMSFGALGSAAYSEAEAAAIRRHPEMVFVAAAGNDGTDTDITPHYPSGIDSPNVVSVAASDQFDRLADFSNYGATSVDLAAPGALILSSYPDFVNRSASEWTFDSSHSLADDWEERQGGLPAWQVTSPIADAEGPGVAVLDVSDSPSPVSGRTELIARSTFDIRQWQSCSLVVRYLVDDPAERSTSEPAFTLSALVATDSASDVHSYPLDTHDTGGRFETTLSVDIGAEGDSLSAAGSVRVGIAVDYDGTAGGRVALDGVQLRCLDSELPAIPQWAFMSGTSMAAPAVAGAAALVLGLRPTLTGAQVRDLLLRSVDRLPAFAGKTVSGGRLDVRRLLELTAAWSPPTGDASGGSTGGTSPGADGAPGGSGGTGSGGAGSSGPPNSPSGSSGTPSPADGTTGVSPLVRRVARALRVSCRRRGTRLRCRLVARVRGATRLSGRVELRKGGRRVATARVRVGRYFTLRSRRLRRSSYALVVRLRDSSGRVAIRTLHVRVR